MERRDIEFPESAWGLREDIRILGTLVGEMLREQGGEALFDRVESARRTAIARREGEADADARLGELLRVLDPRLAEDLVHGFGSYFELVNLAETVHRVRRQRDYARQGSGPQPESLEDTLIRLRDAGVVADEVRDLLADLLVEPVFTAHPTQAVRRTLLEKHQRIGRQLIRRLDQSMTPEEDRTALEAIRTEVTSGWQTEPHPAVRKTVRGELEMLLFYVTDVLYPVIPRFYERLEEALGRVYGDAARALVPAELVRFGSWVGADMDGNPNVTAETIAETLAEHQYQLFGLYRAELHELYRLLSQSLSRVDVDPRVLDRTAHYATIFPEDRERVPARHENMPYRVLLALVMARLASTASEKPGGYETPEQLVDDLQLIAESLRRNQGAHAGLAHVRRLIRRVQTFGFHMLTLDVRQDALVHRRAVSAGLGDPEWLDRDPAERAERLREALRRGGAPRGTDDPDLARMLGALAAVSDGRRRYGRRAVGLYIISMTQGADDVLTVLLLARWAGLCDDRGHVPLDVAPLFETVGDLQAGPGVMAELARDPLYAEHLARRDARQVVMVGYSDSNKDGGMAASRWGVQKAQAELVEVMDAAGLDLTIFHGRGGTVGRGGGKTNQGVAAMPPGSVRRRLRVTEQGETVNEKFGLRPIAERTLEQTVGAVARASTVERPDDALHDERVRLMDDIAQRSRDAYRDLVYGDPGFVEYFRESTPIDVIERMQIGSRPAARRSRSGIEDLRAIPWVFAWTQTRLMLPGWYGLGTGLAEAVEAWGEDAVARSVEAWPFLGNLIDDAEMVLAKSDITIAGHYAELASSGRWGHFERIRAEHRRTIDMILRLKGTGELLDRDPTLQRSIRLRNPYLDPMSLLQVDLLRRWRETDRCDDDLFRALLATINGIAGGLRNTG